MSVRFPAFRDPKKLLLDSLRDRSPAVPDADAIHRPDRGDLRRGPREEDLVGYVEEVSQQRLFAHWNIQVLAQGQGHPPGDPRQNGAGQRGRVNLPVLNHEDVLAAALADYPGPIQ